jgi:hypothetical protein
MVKRNMSRSPNAEVEAMAAEARLARLGEGATPRSMRTPSQGTDRQRIVLKPGHQLGTEDAGGRGNPAATVSGET